jgi:hypothetical protein
MKAFRAREIDADRDGRFRKTDGRADFAETGMIYWEAWALHPIGFARVGALGRTGGQCASDLLQGFPPVWH